jgi:signal transduction histidine kinase
VQLPEDAVVLSFEADAFESYPPDRLAYDPVVSHLSDTEYDFHRIDSLEFRQKDFQRAINELRHISTVDSDPQVRAMALNRLARNYLKANDVDNALKTLQELIVLGDTPVESVPASLLGRYSRCVLLRETNRNSEKETRLLHDDLQKGCWRIDRATYLFYDRQLKDWLGSTSGESPSSPAIPLVLASAANELWSDWQRNLQTGEFDRGYRTVETGRVPILTLLTGSSELTLGIIAGAGHIHEWMLQPMDQLQRDLNIAVRLLDNKGSEFLVPDQPGLQSMQSVRTPLDTGLPWTLAVTIADPEVFETDLMLRRTLVVSGISVLLIGFIGSVYLMGRALARELEAARLKSDFVAAVSHEFRTPLTSLRQFTELLVTGRMSNEPDRQTCYRVLQQETGRLHRLVENLLDFAKMEADALQYHPEEVEMSRLVEGVVSEFRQQVASQGYSVSVTLRDAKVRVKVDQEAISRAIWNLLDNAVKYSPDQKAIEVDVEQDGEFALIRIEDQGLGIRPEEQARIFTRFSRGSSSSQVGSKGTGLGLPMVRRIVEDHGGKIELESKVGKGSIFFVFLPLAK